MGDVSVGGGGGGGGASGGVIYTDRSGTTANANAQIFAPANPNRHGFYFQNISTSTLWISAISTAVATYPSIQILSGGYYENPVGGAPVTALWVIGSTGLVYSAAEW